MLLKSKNRNRGCKMKKRTKRILTSTIVTGLVLGAVIGVFWLYPRYCTYGFETELPEQEVALRQGFIDTAENYLGYKEANGSHKEIIDLYNGHEPLAQGYAVSYEDSWCATYVSAAAIQAGLTEIIPTECGCQRQIGLFQQLGTWQEADDYKPLPGDIIYYCRNNTDPVGDCIGWSDHVGIVVGTNGNRMKVIEGNYGDAVGYRYLKVDATIIRGYGTPDYSTLAQVSD
jgi:hypothetical protein